MKIAKCTPFEGKPRINAPHVFGGTPYKPLLWRVPVTGERPIKITAENLPTGLEIDDKGIVSGVCAPSVQNITITAENTLGVSKKVISFQIADGLLLRTPLLGFTTWNAYFDKVTQEDVQNTASIMISSGIADYGYAYVNLDSSWQGEYGGKYDAIMPNERFPDIKAMCDHIHSLGLRAGIYSTPMKTAWGCPGDRETIPGCTRGEADIRFPMSMSGIGSERMEKNNVAQWSEWGFDYLKYDWTPCDGYNADMMKQELIKSPHDFAFCTTVSAGINYAEYWKRNCNSWRDNPDTQGTWSNHLQSIQGWDIWQKHIGNGHYLDLDMLDIGTMSDYICQLTEDEKILAYTARAFLLSPIQISCKLDRLTEFEMNLFCNEEIIAVNQDSLLKAPSLIKVTEDMRIYVKELDDGNSACAFINLSDQAQQTEYKTDTPCLVRDLWMKEDIGTFAKISLALEPHSARAFKLYRK